MLLSHLGLDGRLPCRQQVLRTTHELENERDVSHNAASNVLLLDNEDNCSPTGEFVGTGLKSGVAV